MVTLYTRGRQVEITYANGDTIPFYTIIGITYFPDRLMFIWNDYTVKTIDNPSGIYKHIACPGCFEIDIK